MGKTVLLSVKSGNQSWSPLLSDYYVVKETESSTFVDVGNGIVEFKGEVGKLVGTDEWFLIRKRN